MIPSVIKNATPEINSDSVIVPSAHHPALFFTQPRDLCIADDIVEVTTKSRTIVEIAVIVVFISIFFSHDI